MRTKPASGTLWPLPQFLPGSCFPSMMDCELEGEIKPFLFKLPWLLVFITRTEKQTRQWLCIKSYVSPSPSALLQSSLLPQLPSTHIVHLSIIVGTWISLANPFYMADLILSSNPTRRSNSYLQGSHKISVRGRRGSAGSFATTWGFRKKSLGSEARPTGLNSLSGGIRSTDQLQSEL